MAELLGSWLIVTPERGTLAPDVYEDPKPGNDVIKTVIVEVVPFVRVIEVVPSALWNLSLIHICYEMLGDNAFAQDKFEDALFSLQTCLQ